MGIPCNRLFIGLLFASFICILQYSRILGTTTSVATLVTEQRDSPQARSSGPRPPPPSADADQKATNVSSSSPKSSSGEAAASTEQTPAQDSPQPPLSKKEEAPPPTTTTEEVGTAVVVAQATPQSRNATPKQGWIYEPKNLGQFWDRMGDRPFISTIYPHLSRFERVLDIGAQDPSDATSATGSDPDKKETEVVASSAGKSLSQSNAETAAARTLPQSRNEAPKERWIYEPRNLDHFWDSNIDRPFQRSFYPRLSQFDQVLDVGARGFNRKCKEYINSTTTKYYQVEPYPPDVMSNDGLLHCLVQEIPKSYPQYAASFDAVIDFGVFGWDAIHRFNTSQEMLDDIRDYMNGILFVLKPKGLWVLKTDKGWVPDEAAIFKDFIDPHFAQGDFAGLKNGHSVSKGEEMYTFYFLYRKGEISSDQIAVTRILPQSRNDTPKEGWIYEPKNVDYFWDKMGDRPFISSVYPRLRDFDRVLDVGARGYNRNCKGFINSTKTKYFQVEPYPPDVMNNDGLLHCMVQEIPKFYPEHAASFDAVLDFGVFGWDAMHKFNTSEEMLDDIRAYMNGLLFVLKPKGLWILKVDTGWVPDEEAIFRDYVLPHFDMGDFDDLKSVHRVEKRGKEFRFYFFYKKAEATPETVTTIGGDTAKTAVATVANTEERKGKMAFSKPEKNLIQVENEQAGTSDWALNKPANDREIEGYTSRTSVQQGDSILLFYNTRSPTVSIEIFRTGWYDGLGARRYAGPVTVSGVVQETPRPNKYGLAACNWTDPYLVQTNQTWTTGIYLARMTEMANGTQSYAIFVVRDDNRLDPPDVTFQLPVNTYHAYNYWAGCSLYGWGCTGADSLPWGFHGGGRNGQKVSFDRPYARSNNPNATHGTGAGEYLTNIQPTHFYPISSSASWNYNMVRWLERNGIDTSYISNVDVHYRLDRLVKPKLFLTQGHDEYWSWTMMDKIEAWRDQGVHLAFLGSNTAYMQVRYEDEVTYSNDDVEPRTLVCFRRPRPDPIRGNLMSIKFREVNRPEANLVGVEYIGDPFDTDLVIADASHWVFNGTGLSNGDAIPGMLGYEVDAMRPKRLGRPEHQINLTPLFETPVIDRGNKTLVCHGTIYTTASGAFVFASGTMQWAWGLDDYNVVQNLRTSRLNKVVEIMTWNLLQAAGISPKVSTKHSL